MTVNRRMASWRLSIACAGIVLATALGGCAGGRDAGTDAASGRPGRGTTRTVDGQPAEETALPDPCGLVPRSVATELLGGPVAEPSPSTSSTTGSISCTWELQKNVDDPDASTIGHTLSLTVHAPMGERTAEEYFDSVATASTAPASVCDASFWIDAQLHALQGGVYLAGLAGLGSDAPDAKAATGVLVRTACDSLAGSS